MNAPLFPTSSLVYSPSVERLRESFRELSVHLDTTDFSMSRIRKTLVPLTLRLKENPVFADLSFNRIRAGLLWGALDERPTGQTPPPTKNFLWSYEQREKIINTCLQWPPSHERPHPPQPPANQAMAYPPTLYVLSGIPGSGKSTWIKQYFSEKLTAGSIVSTDALREKLYGTVHDQAHHAEIFAHAHQLVRQSLRNGQSAVLDATGILKKHRTPLWRMARRLNASSVVVVMDTSLREALIRNQSRGRQVVDTVLARFFLQWQRPTACEADERWVVEQGSRV